MAVDPTNLTTYTTADAAAAAAAAAKKKAANQLDVNDFLTLMTTQLKNQDPLKPLDSSEFVSQLAQFGTVSGIQSMQTSLSQLSEALRTSQALSGSSLVGHQVLAPASDYALGATGNVDGALDLPTGTTSVQMTVEDSAGQIVRTMQLPAGEGFTQFSWDGMTDAGTRAASGAYTIKAIANVGGQQSAVDPMLAARVNSITIDSSGAGLTLNTSNLGAIPLANVRRVM